MLAGAYAQSRDDALPDDGPFPDAVGQRGRSTQDQSRTRAGEEPLPVCACELRLAIQLNVMSNGTLSRVYVICTAVSD